MNAVSDTSSSNPLPPPQAPADLPEPKKHGRIRRTLGKKLPLWALLLTGMLAIGLGAASTSGSADKADAAADAADERADTAEAKVAEAEERADTAEAQRGEANERADTAEAQVAEAEERADTAEAQRGEANERADTAEAQTAEAEARADTAEAQITEADTRADTAETAANQAAEAAYAERTTQLDTRSADLDSRKSQLDQREADVAAREQAVTAAEQGQHAVTFQDGVFMVGRDIQPGTYHNDGPDGSSSIGCYYAKLGSDGSDILDNEIVDGPATVIINTPFFKSSSCGTWTKVG